MTEVPPTSAGPLMGNLLNARVRIRFGQGASTDLLRWAALTLVCVLLGFLFGARLPVFSIRLPLRSRSPARGAARNPARLVTVQEIKKLKDIVLKPEQEAVVTSFRDLLRGAQKFQKLGARLERGALIVGPSGAGKTLLMKVIAGEFNVPTFYATGSEFIDSSPELAVGRIQNLFESAKKNAPCLICIDNIETLVPSRTLWPDSLSLYLEAASSQFLQELDGFDSNQGIIPTSRPQAL